MRKRTRCGKYRDSKYCLVTWQEGWGVLDRTVADDLRKLADDTINIAAAPNIPNQTTTMLFYLFFIGKSYIYTLCV